MKKELKPPEIQTNNLKENKELLYEKLKDIFSKDISGRYTNYCNNHNKKLINILLNKKDEEKKQTFENLFYLTFLECLNHFTGNNYINELDGFKDLNGAFTKYECEQDYLDLLRYYAENFKEILFKKKSRKRKKNYNI